MTVKAESEMASLWIHDYTAIPRATSHLPGAVEYFYAVFQTVLKT